MALIIDFILEWDGVVIGEAAGESLAMNEGGLDEEMAPEEDVSTDIHSNPIPLHDEAWTLQPGLRSL